MEWWQTIITLIGTLGGLELVKWVFNRKANAKIVEAQADSAKIQAEEDEFHLKRERLKFADEQLLEKDRQLADWSNKHYEQTLLVRKQNEQIVSYLAEIGTLKAKIASLEAERAMKLCERRGCPQRQPQSGY
jgi:peptidoglycan hydrolase CwlO-like protein